MPWLNAILHFLRAGTHPDTDLWAGAVRQNNAAREEATANPSPEGIAQGNNSEEPSIDELRDRVINRGFSEAGCSTSAKGVRIVEPDLNDGGEIFGEEESDSFTNTGMRTTHSTSFLKSAEAIFIKAEELHGAGLCCHCGKASRAFLVCAVCHRNICRVCARELDGKTLCPVDFVKAVYNYDLWLPPEGGRR